jgi:hypothetical protein
MTSQITYGLINENFPVPGADNDSQGFRDNWTQIKTALETAKQELTELQTNAIISADLATSSQPVQNDLKNSALYNGVYYQMYGLAPGTKNVASSGVATEINISAGPLQRFYLLPIINSLIINDGTFSHTFSLAWNNVAANKFAKMRLFFSARSDDNNVYSVNLTPAGANNLHYSTNYPSIPGTNFRGFTLGGESVDRVTVSVAGSGYITVPNVQFTGATTHGWNSKNPSATVKFKAVPTSTITAGGTGYAVSDRIIINGQPDIILQVTNIDPGGVITGLSIIQAGSYNLPIVGAQATTALFGNGSDAFISINNGIESVVITNAGDGYVVAPIVTIDAPGSGVQATATAFLSSNTRNNSHVVEAWTMDGGVNVYLDYIGEYKLS